jgi:hypothetical protein
LIDCWLLYAALAQKGYIAARANSNICTILKHIFKIRQKVLQYTKILD